MVTFLTLTVALLVEPRLSLSGPVGAAEEDSLAIECARKMEKIFPLVTIQAQELALDHARVKLVEQQYIVIIPLKEPRRDMRIIQWAQKDPTVALEFIRLLRLGKIGAVNVWPFLHNPGELYITRGIPREVLKACQKEQIKEAFGTCAECEVVEWLNLQP
jgi:hypothetical protein